jgi:hypothetical protein
MSTTTANNQIDVHISKQVAEFDAQLVSQMEEASRFFDEQLQRSTEVRQREKPYLFWTVEGQYDDPSNVIVKVEYHEGGAAFEGSEWRQSPSPWRMTLRKMPVARFRMPHNRRDLMYQLLMAVNGVHLDRVISSLEKLIQQCEQEEEAQRGQRS